MVKLKLGPLVEDKPVADPVRLIAPMLERFIVSNRGFARARRKVI